ncbi:MAG: NlpC/P60 family protein, partial [Lachnospiraceae bacterium]|nr:NlpC/P60 family protein [Lachnospiraceae bacterium]
GFMRPAGLFFSIQLSNTRDADKQPGDVVCYYGHVGIYIGNNQIVHASTASTGIKVSNMYYRSIRCIRRYW